MVATPGGAGETAPMATLPPGLAGEGGGGTPGAAPGWLAATSAMTCAACAAGERWGGTGVGQNQSAVRAWCSALRTPLPQGDAPAASCQAPCRQLGCPPAAAAGARSPHGWSAAVCVCGGGHGESQPLARPHTRSRKLPSTHPHPHTWFAYASPSPPPGTASASQKGGSAPRFSRPHIHASAWRWWGKRRVASRGGGGLPCGRGPRPPWPI